MSPHVALGLGFLCIVGAVVCALLARHERLLLSAFEGRPSTPIGRIKGPGYFEVKGRVVCEHPLVAPGTGEKCVYFRVEIDERTQDTDLQFDGTVRTRTHTSQDVHEEDSCVFQIQDATGAINVLPSRADFEGVMVLNEDRINPLVWVVGQIAELAGLPISLTVADSTKVRTIRPGQTVCAVGRVVQMRNGLFLQHDEEENRPFVISVRSGSEIAAEHKQWLYQYAAAAVGLTIAGLVLMLLGRGHH